MRDDVRDQLTAWLQAIRPKASDVAAGISRALAIARMDPEMALVRCRKVLEGIIRQKFEAAVSEPAGTRPLENLLQQLAREKVLPRRITVFANAVREFGNLAVHGPSENVTEDDFALCVTQLCHIVKWHLGLSNTPPIPNIHSSRLRPPSSGGSQRRRAPEEIVVAAPRAFKAFDAADHDIYMSLAPGARDENGFPESLTFWKSRIETTQTPTFSVAVLYGPSGAGKSSFVRSGLLPLLRHDVKVVTVDATGRDTIADLSQQLETLVPTGGANPPERGALLHAIKKVRDSVRTKDDAKVLICIDQFEQHLAEHRVPDVDPLVQALRQCDGTRIQCLLIVREEFWMAVTRVFRALDLRLVQADTFSAIDLLDRRLARQILIAFGRYLGKFADDESLTADQKEFIGQGIEVLTIDGRVMPIRLALFVEIFRDRDWTASAVEQQGGIDTLAIAYLDEMFSASSPHFLARAHFSQCRLVLGALARGVTPLRTVSLNRGQVASLVGYGDGSQLLEELIDLLSGQLRLIARIDESATTPSTEESREPRFRLSHDYLVPLIRGWSETNAVRTRSGRAFRMANDYASLWEHDRRARNLPRLGEWLYIATFARKAEYGRLTADFRRAARRSSLSRIALITGLTAAIAVVLLSDYWLTLRRQERLTQTALLTRIRDCDKHGLAGVLEECDRSNAELRRLVEQKLRQPDLGDSERVRYAFVDHLFERQEDAFILRHLRSFDPDDIRALVAIDTAVPIEFEQIARAAFAGSGVDEKLLLRVVAFSCHGERVKVVPLESVAPQIADALVKEDPINIGSWAELLQPAHLALLPELRRLMTSANRPNAERIMAVSLIGRFALDQPSELVEALDAAEEDQFGKLFDAVVKADAAGEAELGRAFDALKRRNNRQQTDALVNAAIALSLLGKSDSLLGLLDSDDPAVRAAAVHKIPLFGVPPARVCEWFLASHHLTRSAALLLALGGYPEASLRAAVPPSVRKLIKQAYVQSPSRGVHSSARWALTRLGCTAAELRALTNDGLSRDRTAEWITNSIGQDLVVLKPPISGVATGSPEDEPYRDSNERIRSIVIPREYAIASTEVTVAQFEAFLAATHNDSRRINRSFSPTAQSPITDVTWPEAVAFCRWLDAVEHCPEDQACYTTSATTHSVMVAPGCLERTGYRLPTEAEWEFACRGGCRDMWCFGNNARLLDDYAWYINNSEDHGHDVAAKRPNGYGLFDMHGNVWEWCHDRFDRDIDLNRPERGVDGSWGDVFRDRDRRVLRGGAFGWHAAMLRSARRNSQAPTFVYHLYGFRVARTIRSHAMLKIVSGGQTGVDRAALDAAIKAGVAYGGWCPAGRRAEDGAIPARYDLAETPSDDYSERTEWNVRDSDGTLIVLPDGVASAGTALTKNLCDKYTRPVIVVSLLDLDNVSRLEDWMRTQHIKTLNIAGPRESESPGIYSKLLTSMLATLPQLGKAVRQAEGTTPSSHGAGR